MAEHAAWLRVSSSFRPLEVEVEGVRLVWCGGRVADVVMPTRGDPVPHAVECLQVGEYDWERGELVAAPTPLALRCRLRDWIRDAYSTAWENE